MIRSRVNQPRQKTEEKLQELIQRLLQEQRSDLPSERELALLTGGSRSVIRKILDDFEDSNLLQKTANGRVINPSAYRIPVLFVGHGRNMLDNPAWMRLWMNFHKRCEATILAPEQFLLRYWPEEIQADLARLAKCPHQYIIVTNTRALEEQLVVWRNSGRQVIFTDEHNDGYGFPRICVDNACAGRMAAQELFAHGFRRPAMIDFSLPQRRYAPYEKRLEGFQNVCANNKMIFSPQEDRYDIPLERGKFQKLIRHIGEIVRKGVYDSVFLGDDAYLHFALEVFADYGVFIPGDMGFITVNCSNNACTNTSSVNSISHATFSVSRHLVQAILDHVHGQGDNIKDCIIPPRLHEGDTLCTRAHHQRCQDAAPSP